MVKKVEDESIVTNNSNKLVCGIIMPISPLDGLSESHWLDIRSILNEAIEAAGFHPRLVSDSTDVGIIQARIVQNLYDDPMVICDVSGKNPNVMFELGLRLAFDKPTIIIKDDHTTYNFDTSPIEHLGYPRDLRFNSIIKFKEDLTNKIKATYATSQKDSEYSTFLKHFGKYKIAKLSEKEISSDKYIINSIEKLVEDVSSIKRNITSIEKGYSSDANSLLVSVPNVDEQQLYLTVKKGISNFIKNNELADQWEIKDKNLTHELVLDIWTKVNPTRKSIAVKDLIKKHVDSILNSAF